MANLAWYHDPDGRNWIIQAICGILAIPMVTTPMVFLVHRLDVNLKLYIFCFFSLGVSVVRFVGLHLHDSIMTWDRVNLRYNYYRTASGAHPITYGMCCLFVIVTINAALVITLVTFSCYNVLADCTFVAGAFIGNHISPLSRDWIMRIEWSKVGYYYSPSDTHKIVYGICVLFASVTVNAPIISLFILLNGSRTAFFICGEFLGLFVVNPVARVLHDLIITLDGLYVQHERTDALEEKELAGEHETYHQKWLPGDIKVEVVPNPNPSLEDEMDAARYRIARSLCL